MDSSFGVLDAFAFVVFAVLIAAGVIIFVSLGQLPGSLARKWNHPQAVPLALIWAFMNPLRGPVARAAADEEPPA
jgi:hypothetical protein